MQKSPDAFNMPTIILRNGRPEANPLGTKVTGVAESQLEHFKAFRKFGEGFFSCFPSSNGIPSLSQGITGDDVTKIYVTFS